MTRGFFVSSMREIAMQPPKDYEVETETQEDPAVARDRLLRLLQLLAKGIVRRMQSGENEKPCAEDGRP
jgi:hypothetical protein